MIDRQTNNFYIATMPRSGSAWLANLLTTGNVFAHHEILRGSSDGKPSWIGGYAHEGAVGCDLALWPEVIDGPLVLVTRSPEECFQSAVRAGTPATATRSLVMECMQGMYALQSKAKLVLSWQDLFKVDTIIDIGLALELPPWDAMRIKQLLATNVQSTLAEPHYSCSPYFHSQLRDRLKLTATGDDVR